MLLPENDSDKNVFNKLGLIILINVNEKKCCVTLLKPLTFSAKMYERRIQFKSKCLL